MPLHASGVNNYALPLNEAIAFVNLCESQDVPILGGDVYGDKNGKLSITYDNWYVDLQEGEANHDFCTRSCDAARRYLAGFPSDFDGAFALVIAVRRPDGF